MFRPLLVAAAFIVGPSVPAIAQDAHGVVAATGARYDQIWNTRDAQALARLYTDDTLILPPGAPAASGTQGVVGFFQPLFKNNWSNHKLEPVTATQVSDSLVVGSVHWFADMADKDGKTTRYHGDAVQVLTKVGDEWKIKLASWNVIPDK